MTIPGHSSRSDWDRVRREAAEEAPILHDPGDGPYDPNDEAATDSCWQPSVPLEELAPAPLRAKAS